MSNFFDQADISIQSDPPLWPLVMLFGSYRGDGEEKLREISEYLRKNKIRAYIVSEYGPIHCHRKKKETNDEYNLRVSFWCTEHCDIAVFVFFRGITIGVEEALESLDQGPMLELAHICERGIHEKDLLFVFDSKSRKDASSSLFRGIVKKSLGKPSFPCVVIEGKSPDEIIKEMKLEILGYCRRRYAKYATVTRVGPLKFRHMFGLGAEEKE